jgi:small subunit ribosomal protein S11
LEFGACNLVLFCEAKAMGKKRVIQPTKEELLKEREKIDAKVKKETKTIARKVKDARVYIFSSYNNTTFTLTDNQGNVLGWSSSGSLGFKGAKKATPFAASKVAEVVLQIIKKLGIDKVSLYVKGVGSGRDSAIRSLAAKGLNIVSIKDITPVPHNGCRPPKPRRL